MLPGSTWISAVSEWFKTPAGALITVVFVGSEFASPAHDVKIWFFTYAANTNVLTSLASFGISGIYLSLLLTVIGSIIAAHRGREIGEHLIDGEALVAAVTEPVPVPEGAVPGSEDPDAS